MVEYIDSSQLNLWHFESVEELEICRSYTNFQARQFLFDRESGDNNSNNAMASPAAAVVGTLPVSHFACDRTRRSEVYKEGLTINYAEKGPLGSPAGKPYLLASEEAVLVSFYVSKLPALIGPVAEVRRLRRESKVLATAAALYRRFFISNSVMLYDPKVIMVAAAFLASKVEDATADVRYLEEGTVAMNAAVTTQQIVVAEVALLAGTHFHLLCFHPYKAVLALTEDLRTFLKTAAGKKLQPHQDHQLTGQDLKPMYDTARNILDDVVVSDVPLLSSPGQIGLAALTVAQDTVSGDGSASPGSSGGAPPSATTKIDLLEYLQARFPHETAEWMPSTVQTLATMIRELKQGRHGCGNYNTPLADLKGIHKKLKSARAWGEKKKRSKATDSTTDEATPPSKRVKTE